MFVTKRLLLTTRCPRQLMLNARQEESLLQPTAVRQLQQQLLLWPKRTCQCRPCLRAAIRVLLTDSARRSASFVATASLDKAVESSPAIAIRYAATVPE